MQNYRHEFAKDTPTAAAEVVLFQDSDGVSLTGGRPELYGSWTELDVALLVDQNVTLIHKWGPTLTTADADMEIINGATYTGETVTKDIFFERTLQHHPGRNRISIVAGTPAPTATKIACCRYDGPRVV